jgi:hypothetical protein
MQTVKDINDIYENEAKRPFFDLQAKSAEDVNS